MKTVTLPDDPSFVRALAHPLRARILGVLQERRASPKELAEEFGAPLGNVSYHVRRLADLKLIRLVKKTPRRGAVEHHYEAVAAAAIEDRAWGRVPSIVKEAMIGAALDEVARSVTDAATMGGFDRAQAHLSRSRVVLDQQGWTELAELLARTIADAERIGEQSERRLKRADHHDESRASLVMMLFDQPTAPGAPPVADGPTARPARRSKVKAAHA